MLVDNVEAFKNLISITMLKSRITPASKSVGIKSKGQISSQANIPLEKTINDVLNDREVLLYIEAKLRGRQFPCKNTRILI